MSVKQQSALEKEVTSLRYQLFGAAPTPAVDVESKLASVCEDSAVANDKIGKLRAEVKKCRYQMDCDLQKASAHYSRAVDERQKADSGHRHAVLA